MAYDIFLSYRRTDQELAKALVDAMTAVGLDVWWDQRIEGGEDWREAIVAGLTGSHALVILFSEECNESKQLKKELAIADTLDKEVIPVLVEDTKPRGHYLYELAARNWLQIHPNPLAKVNELAGRLAAELQTERGGMSGRVSPAPAQATQAPGAAASPPSAAPSSPTAAAPDHDEPPLQAETVEKVVAATRRQQGAVKGRRDFLPFKWFEVVIAAVLAGLAVYGGYDVDTGEAIRQALMLDGLGTFFFVLVVIAIVVFPFRYYFRRRRVWRAVRYYALSIFALTMVLGTIFGIHPDIASDDLGLGENLAVALIGSLIIFGLLAIVSFGIYGLLHFQRAMRSFNRNVEAI
ncbi:MAG: toll/interleukin-1 receptor domain-containing protein [Pseudomonadota bacterium]